LNTLIIKLMLRKWGNWYLRAKKLWKNILERNTSFTNVNQFKSQSTEFKLQSAYLNMVQQRKEQDKFLLGTEWVQGEYKKAVHVRFLSEITYLGLIT
jgi:hypothetical protein